MTNGNSGERLNRIENAIENLTKLVSENRADIAASHARMDALIQTIAESTARSEARMSQAQQRMDQFEESVNGIYQRLDQILARLT